MSKNRIEELNDEIVMQPSLDLDDAGAEVEDTSSTAAITEPFDPTLIRVEAKILTLDIIIGRIRHGEINMMPEFQRSAGIWKNDAQSRLIESILVRIPLPAFYMDGTDEDKWLVVDGLQRLTTLKRFIIDKELSLIGLEFLTDHENKKYDDLPRLFQRRINETQVTVYLIEQGTPPELKFNVFKRINTGGLPLSPQEIRHALNQGKSTKLLSELADSKEFKLATSNGIKSNRMADRECVLRFFAFCLKPYHSYRSNDFDAFLSDVMSAINIMDDDAIQKLRERFKRAMVTAKMVFGDEAFRKKYTISGHHRNPINKALFESWSVNLDALSDTDIKILINKKNELIIKFVKIMNDRDFLSAISQGTGSLNNVYRRFDEIERIIREVIQ